MLLSIIEFLCISFIGTVGFYNYDSIAVFGPYLQNIGYSKVQISLLYSIYYYPNIIFSILLGCLVDKWGTLKSLFLFSSLSVMACLISCISLNFAVLCIGRVLLGISAEAIFICQIKLFTINYPNHRSLVFGLSLLYNRLASFLSYITLPLVVENISLSWGFYTCFIISVCCFIVNIVYYLLFGRDEKTFVAEKYNILSNIRDCLKNIDFLLLLGWTFTLYGAFMSFNALAPIIILQKLSINAEKANQLVSLLTFGSMVASIFAGLFTNKFGKHYLVNGIGILVGLVSMSVFLFPMTVATTIVVMLFLGFCYGIVPSLLYRCISFVVAEEKMGIATGCIESINALTVCITPTIFSLLYQDDNLVVAITFIIVLLFGTFVLNMVSGLRSVINGYQQLV